MLSGHRLDPSVCEHCIALQQMTILLVNYLKSENHDGKTEMCRLFHKVCCSAASCVDLNIVSSQRDHCTLKKKQRVALCSQFFCHTLTHNMFD